MNLNLSNEFLAALDSAAQRDSVLAFDHDGKRFVVMPLPLVESLTAQAGAELRYLKTH